MIREYVGALAGQMGIRVPKISVIEGREVGCLGVHLLHLVTAGHQISALVHQSELDDLQRNSSCERLETKIRSALLRLEVKLASDDTVS